MSGISNGTQQRPAAVILAVACSVVNGVGGAIFSATWPDVDERATTVTVSIVVATILIGAAWWLLGGSRWGAIATLAVNAFSVLLAVPAYFTGQNAAFIVGATISLVLSVLTIWFVLTPSARAYWGQGGALRRPDLLHPPGQQ